MQARLGRALRRLPGLDRPLNDEPCSQPHETGGFMKR